MRHAITVAIALLLTACAAPSAPNGQHTHDGSTHSHDTLPDGFPAAPKGQICGGKMIDGAQTCEAPNEYCHRTIAQICGWADAPGVCRVKPEMCTQEYAPVCGCDGVTYSNECTANGNGVSASAQDPCK